MSIFGRNFIDKLKNTLSHRSVLLPVPPYTDANYWDKVYKTLSASDVYEWGDFTLGDLLLKSDASPLGVMKYRRVYLDGIRDLYGNDTLFKQRKSGGPVTGTNASTSSISDSDSRGVNESLMVEEEFHKAIRVSISPVELAPEEDQRATITSNENQSFQSSSSSESQNILILGCGNSNFGEELYHYYYGHPPWTTSTNVNTQPKPPAKIIQCDISANVVRSMNERYNLLPMNGNDEDDQDGDVKHRDPGSDNYDDGYDSNDFDTNIQDETSMTMRATSYPHMSIVQADATNFPSTYSNKFSAVIDKGLIDALFCCTSRVGTSSTTTSSSDHRHADNDEQSSSKITKSSLKMNVVQRVMKSVHGVLQPGAVFMFFSFSRPEYLLGETVVRDDEQHHKQISTTNDVVVGMTRSTDNDHLLDLWSEVDVCELDRIFMYRFVKKKRVTTDTTVNGLDDGSGANGSSSYGMDLDGLPSLRGTLKKRRT